MKFGMHAVTVPCETIESNEAIPELACHLLTVARKVIAVPGETTAIPLQQREWVEGPEVGIQLEPANELRSLGLELASGYRHSSMNAPSFILCRNRTNKEIEIPEGLPGAWARTESQHASVTGQPLSEGEQKPSRILLAAELESLEELQQRPFAEGGPPVTDADFESLELNLKDCIDPLRRRPDGTYEPLAQKWIERIKELASRWWLVWSRDARAPRISQLVVVDIPTGNATPIAQKPYPIPQRYVQAVREELQKLLDAGLIEPGISNWASPTLLTVKKDSTAEHLKIKLVIDFRKLNAVTIPDTGGLGNIEEILQSFGHGQKYIGIADIAGGFYQFALNPLDRHKTAFVLPSSMGGTTFQWKVCPDCQRRTLVG